MRVKIVKCSRSDNWYKDLIGKEFDAVRFTNDLYSIGGYVVGGSLVLVKDCEIIPEVQNTNYDAVIAEMKSLKESFSRESIFNDEYFRRQLILSLAGNSSIHNKHFGANYGDLLLLNVDKIMEAMKK